MCMNVEVEILIMPMPCVRWSCNEQALCVGHKKKWHRLVRIGAILVVPVNITVKSRVARVRNFFSVGINLYVFRVGPHTSPDRPVRAVCTWKPVQPNRDQSWLAQQPLVWMCCRRRKRNDSGNDAALLAINTYSTGIAASPVSKAKFG
jgi:hypothetical protein